MSGALVLRAAGPEDAAGCAAVYAPYVRETAVSFEEEPPTAAELARRIADAHVWLVLEDEGRVVGYACAGPWRSRPAYRWACETSVYVEVGRRRSGAGRMLYAELLARLRDRGFRTALAGMTAPNPASLGLHLAMGFTEVGTFARVGFKRGAWHDVLWVQQTLVGPEQADQPPDDVS